jgi:PTH1 family peptidyl-tRNA hydrolase
MKTILLAGLGNPGKEYADTRHNAGFMFVDHFREIETGANFSEWDFNKKLNAQICSGRFEGKKMILLKPQTFMNLSGEAIKKALSFFKIKPESLTVVHDEIDLPLGTLRVSKSASSAGHQGVQNIIDQLGTKDFTRIRIGVDNRGGKKMATEKYVLGKFTLKELGTVKKDIESSLSELIIKLKS